MFSQQLLSKLSIPNLLIPEPNLMVGGQPSVEDFHLLKQLGICQVINLRPISEKIDFDQVALLEKLGLEYHIIPLTTLDTFTQDTAIALDKLLGLNQTTLIHCASGNRVGALFALRALWLEGLTPNKALDKGLATGLTSYKAGVKKILTLH